MRSLNGGCQGVPTVVHLKDGRLLAAFQHFPENDSRNFDRVAVRFSSDEGRVWSKPEPIVVEGMGKGLMRPFDPTLVPLPDGRVRLYFTSNRSPDFQRSTRNVTIKAGEPPDLQEVQLIRLR